MKPESPRAHHPMLLACLAVGLVSMAVPAKATPPPTGLAPTLMPQQGFGIDGDLFARQPEASSGDWIVASDLPGIGEGVMNTDGTPLNPTVTFHFIDPYNDSGNDYIFTGGSKWADDPGTWAWTTGKPSSKTDINNVLLHLASDTNGHTWVVLSADRMSTSGDSYIDFELLQNPVVRTNNGAFQSWGPDGGRTVGDLVLSLAFTGGGKVADFFAWRWEPDGSKGYAYVDVTSALPAGRVYVALNTDRVPVSYPAFGGMEYQPNAFAEAAVDLTALLAGFDPCESFGFETIMVKTKSSASYSAGIEDFIDPIAYELRIGPAADAGEDQVRCADADATEFPLSGSASAGLTSVASVEWSVVEGTASVDDPTSLITTARVSSASATLRLEVTQNNGCVDTDDVVLRAVQPPSATISGPGTLCPDAVATFSAPAGMDSYAWSVSGNGAILGPVDQESVTVLSSNVCGENLELTLVVSSNVCSVASVSDVLVQDTTPPELVIPDDLVLECPAETGTNATGVATASDDCGAVQLTYVDSTTNLCGGAQIVSRQWTAVDSCGNTTSAVQTIEVQDTVPPVLSVPPNLTLEAPADTSTTSTGVASAQDACGLPTVTFTDVVTPGCGSAKTIARTWSAIDDCGNLTSATQTIQVQDTTAPTLSLPSDLTLECPADTSSAATGLAVAEDNGGTATVTFSDEVIPGCGETRTILRTWSAEDECGNLASAVQTITVQDTIAPTLSIPPDLTLECPADTTAAATGIASAQDACGTAEVSFSDAVTPGCGGSLSIARTWSAVDECGNTATATQTIVVQDTTAPRLSLPPDLTLECPADTSTTATGIASAEDACGTATVSFSDVVTPGCGASETIVRTWSAVDECGNTATATQTIVVQDTTPPVLSIPPAMTLECPADTSTAATGVATAEDNCGIPTVSFSDVVTPGCGSSHTIARTWTAVDECGNTSAAVQTITVEDTTPPVIDVPPIVHVELGESTDPDDTGWAQGEDACGTVRITYVETITPRCGATKVIGRAWMAQDECLNNSYGYQQVIVDDTTPPALTLPPDVILECPADTSPNNTGVATATDLNGEVTISHTDVVTPGDCGGSMQIDRTWLAVDVCGNSTSGTQTILVQDTTPPKVTCPSIKIQCEGDVPEPYSGLLPFVRDGGKATDTCGGSLKLKLISDSGLVGSCPGTVTRVYRVTDSCGNFTDCTQIITVDDTIAPTIACPGPVTIDCGDSMDPAQLGTATAFDNCDPEVDVTYRDTQVPSDYQIKWYSSDPNLNTGPYSPTYAKLAPASLSCPDEAGLTGRAIDPLRHAVAYAAPGGQLDALTSLGGEPMCFGQIVPFQAVIEVGGGPGPERGRIEFTSSWSTHTTSNERFGYDPNYMVYCAFVDYADPGTVDPHYNARVESYSATLANPGTIAEQIMGTFTVSGLDSGDRVIVEVWVVLMPDKPDKVGGTIASELVSARKLSDASEPITVGTQTVSIGNLSKIKSLPAAADQPPAPELPPQPEVPPGMLISVIDRTWSAVDDCGNQDNCVQRITIWDSTPPVVSWPASITLECGAPTDPDSTGWAEAIDACGTAEVQYTDTITPLCGGSRTIDRLWTALDEWGNTTSMVQTLTVQDTTPPVFQPLADITVNAGDPFALAAPLAEDECSAVEVNIASLVTNTLPDGSYTVLCTYEAIDACGNVAQASHNIAVVVLPNPKLTMALSNGLLQISWPAEPDGWWLESTTAMEGPNWKPVAITPILANGRYTVEMVPTGSGQWFRLASGSPPLALSKGSSGQLVASWPSLATGYTLLRCEDLSAGLWEPEPASTQIIDGLHRVMIDGSEAYGLFKLVRPAAQ